MEYRSVNDLNVDLDQWARTLPSDVDVIAGVPRSGMLVATLLALKLNLPLTDVSGLLSGRVLTGGERARRSENPHVIATARRILVVDDSVHSGHALEVVRDLLHDFGGAERLLFGAPYVDPSATNKVDLFWAKVQQPRVFEWNLFHHDMLMNSCVDIDGVLCADPTSSENDDGPAYVAFLTSTRPRVVPSVEIGWLVTSRLERYRKQTEGWLQTNGIRYRHLVMHPATSGQERQLASDHAARKAATYSQVRAELFIESSLRQAVQIATRSARPVFCVETASMIRPGDRTDGRRRDYRTIAAQCIYRARLTGRRALNAFSNHAPSRSADQSG